jgi:catalase
MTPEDTESLLVTRLASILDQNPRLHSILHSRGVDIQGTFTAAPTARDLTDAPAFDGHSKRFTGRLSGTLGGPTAHDAHSGDHGLAIRIDDGGSAGHSFFGFTLPAFFVRRAADMLDFLAATKPDPVTAEPVPSRIEGYLQHHPESGAALAEVDPTPVASFTGLRFHSVHSFGLHSGNREACTWVRLEAHGPHEIDHLSGDEAAGRAADYLRRELSTSLPATFTWWARLPGPDDPVDDPTQPWTSDTRLHLGDFTIQSIPAGTPPPPELDQIGNWLPPRDDLFRDRVRLYNAARALRRGAVR